MKTIFFDTQTHIYITEKQDPIENAAFENLIAQNSFHLVCSFYNLVEFAKSQDTIQSIALASIFNRISTLWSLDFHAIQTDELYNFIMRHFYGFTTQPIKTLFSFHELYSGAFSSPEQVIIAARNEMPSFEKTFAQNAGALDILTKHGKLSDNLQKAALRTNIVQKMMRIENRNRIPPLWDSSNITNDIITNKRKLLLRENICMATEHHLSNFRSSNKHRIARNSDAIDLVTAVAIFPHVDIFITNDGFLKNGLEYVKKQTSIKTKIYKKLSDIQL